MELTPESEKIEKDSIVPEISPKIDGANKRVELKKVANGTKPERSEIS